MIKCEELTQIQKRENFININVSERVVSKGSLLNGFLINLLTKNKNILI